MRFPESLRGLNEGALVVFSVTTAGKVTDVRLEFDKQNIEFSTLVTIEIESRRLISAADEPSQEDSRWMMDYLVKKGLRAQLKTGNILTGQMIVAIDMFHHAEPARINWDGRYPEFSTKKAPIVQQSRQLEGILAKLDQVPFDQIDKDLRNTVRNVKQLTDSRELREALLSLNATLGDAHQISTELRTDVAPQLAETLQ
jgi:paraquat-inducible protein B